MPALDAQSSIRVPKNANGGTAAPINPSFRSPWIDKSLDDLAKVLKTDVPRLGAFVKPETLVVADERTASDGTLRWVNTHSGTIESVRATARCTALHLWKGTKWQEVKRRWEERKARDGDVLDDVLGC